MSTNPVPRAYRDAAEHTPRGVQAGQWVASVDDDAVVFLIGMRVNRWRRVRSWWPVFTGMPRMLAELQAAPDAGLLSARTYWSGRVFLSVQYWQSLEHLGAFARNPKMTHAPAWGAFNRRAAGGGDVGIFHETYRVPADGIESLYGNMPPFGLAMAHDAITRAQRSARTATHDEMGSTDPEYVEAP